MYFVCILDPILSSVYMLPLGHIIHNQNVSYNFYADDTQIHLLLKPGDSNSPALLNCLNHIKCWRTTFFFLQLNQSKPDILTSGANTPHVFY